MNVLDRNVRLIVVGWGVFVVMALLVIAVRGADHVANMAVFIAVAVGMAVWLVVRRSRAAVITSLVLGALHTLQQVAYLVAGATSDDVDVAELVVDAVGLASGVLLVAGGVLALRTRRRSPVDASV